MTSIVIVKKFDIEILIKIDMIVEQLEKIGLVTLSVFPSVCLSGPSVPRFVA